MTTTQTILYIFILIGGALLAQFLLAYAKWKQQHTAALKANSQILDTARGPLEYTSIGQGPLIVVLHGTPGGYDQASIFAQLLALPDFECLSISRPGYLRTPLSTGQTPAQQADALAAGLDALGITQAAVIGISGGGPTALEFTLRHPARCWGLIMVCAVSYRATPEKPPLALRLQSIMIQIEFLTNLMAMMAEAWAKKLVGLAIADRQQSQRVLADPQKLSLFTAMLQTNSIFSLRRAGRSNDQAQELNLPDYDFGKIDTPTIAFHGTADLNVPLAHAELVAAKVPNSQLEIFEDGGHLFYLPFREEFVAHLATFLNLSPPRISFQ